MYAKFSRRSASHRNHDRNCGRRAFEALEGRTMFDATIEPAPASAASEPDPNAPGCTIPFLAPVVYQARFDDERAPHTISIAFSEDVWASLDPQDLTLIDENGRYVYDTRVATVNWDADTNTAHWVFVRADGGALPEGKWHATLNADEVFDADGHALDGDGDGTPGGSTRSSSGSCAATPTTTAASTDGTSTCSRRTSAGRARSARATSTTTGAWT